MPIHLEWPEKYVRNILVEASVDASELGLHTKEFITEGYSVVRNKLHVVRHLRVGQGFSRFAFSSCKPTRKVKMWVNRWVATVACTNKLEVLFTRSNSEPNLQLLIAENCLVR